MKSVQTRQQTSQVFPKVQLIYNVHILSMPAFCFCRADLNGAHILAIIGGLCNQKNVYLLCLLKGTHKTAAKFEHLFYT